MILISEVASLGRDFERMGQQLGPAKIKTTLPDYWDYGAGNSEEENSTGPYLVRDRQSTRKENVIDGGRRDKLTGSLSPSQKIKIMQLLDSWEEPETVRKRDVSLRDDAFVSSHKSTHHLTHSSCRFARWDRVGHRSTQFFNSGHWC